MYKGDSMEDLLAIKLRPKTLSDVIGQEHLVGKDMVIYNLVKNKKLFSMILYGHPGIGKTSIATAICNEYKMKYRTLNAVVNNKKDFDIVIEEAKLYGSMILLVDEIHRLNKDKQDILLPYLESGIITLIGMTTANPYHAINPAIRSRCQLFELKDLSFEDIKKGINKAINSDFLEDIVIDEDASDYIATIAGSDLRFAYNLLEVAYYSTTDKHITLSVVKKVRNRTNSFHDKNGDGYYDVISAFQKSIRGSDVNGALHYLARLIDADDLDIITRRLSVIVYEDIGLANPSMGPKVDAAINCALRLGLPEARIVLSAIVIELALSPKSNSAEMAIDLALNDVRNGTLEDVPRHLRKNSPDYKYPHDYKNDYVKQQYLPDNLINKKYYFPKDNKNEKILKDIMDKLSKL